MPRYWVQYAWDNDQVTEYDTTLVTTKDAKEAEQVVLTIFPNAEIMEVKEDT